METRIVEVTQDLQSGFNWGKILFAEFTFEWTNPSLISGSTSILRERGWGQNHRLVVDLETGEGAMFSFPIGSARADLMKRKVWVCPMFEPVLQWCQETGWDGTLDTLPAVIELPNAEPAMAGYRRPGVDLDEMLNLVDFIRDGDAWQVWIVSRCYGTVQRCTEPYVPKKEQWGWKAPAYPGYPNGQTCFAGYPTRKAAAVGLVERIVLAEAG